MMTETPDDLLRDWLLHRVSQDEAAAMERWILLDPVLADRVREVEYDLLDDDVRGALSKADHDAVHRYLLRGPDAAVRMASARVLASRGAVQATANAAIPASKPPANHPPVPGTPQAPLRRRYAVRRVAWTGALAASAIVTALLASRFPQTPEPVQPPAGGGTVANITLFASSERGTAPASHLAIPHAATAIQLQVETPAGDETNVYTLSVDGTTGTRYVSGSLTPMQAGPYHYVQALVPGAFLASGPHEVTLAHDGKPDHVWHITIERGR